MPRKKTADLSIHKPLVPVYLLYGTQDYLIRMLRDKIVAEALPQEERDVCLTRYDMLTVPLETAVEDADTLPFLGEKKVVILDHCFFLTGERPKKKVEQDPAVLQRYLKQPSPDTVLIMIAPYEKLDGRKKLVRLLNKQPTCAVYELSRIDDRTLYRTLEHVAGEYGGVYTRGGHEQLTASFGDSLSQLVNETAKCALYCGPDRPIDRTAVLEIGAHSLETNVFLLVDRVMAGRTADALHILHDLVDMKEEPLKLLSLLERQFRIVYQVSFYLQIGYTQSAVASKIGLHPYVVKLAAGQAKHFTVDVLEKMMVRCAETDERIKTGRADKLFALELLVYRLSEAA